MTGMPGHVSIQNRQIHVVTGNDVNRLNTIRGHYDAIASLLQFLLAELAYARFIVGE
jgi:hypothetical protein